MSIRTQHGQAATETMLSMMFMLLMIFGAIQLCWWSANKYLANLAAFGAARTAMVGGPQNEQMIAARQLFNARGEGAGPRLVPMSRRYGGGGGGGNPGGLMNGLLQQVNGLMQQLQNIQRTIIPTLRAQMGGLMGGIGGRLPSGVSNMIFQLGLPTNLGGMLGGLLNNALGGLSGLFGGGGGGRSREGLAYVVNARGGLPIQDGVRVVGWSHVVIQPNIAETGDNVGGYYGGFAGFTGGLGGLGALFGNINQILGNIGNLNINQLLQNVTPALQQMFNQGQQPPPTGLPPFVPGQ